jgi:hypothetical protein
VPDQQVREDRGQLPEHIQQEQVVADDQAEHRSGEADEDTGELAEARLAHVEVPRAVHQHQRRSR